jgi:pimeloyl-ACP methyl ester carboxylesterase
MPLGYFFMANWKKNVLVLLMSMVAAPFGLLHLIVLCSRIFEPKLQAITITSIPIASGLSLRVYRRDNPRSDTTLVFIHGSPASARAFQAQFAERFLDTSLVA